MGPGQPRRPLERPFEEHRREAGQHQSATAHAATLPHTLNRWPTIAGREYQRRPMPEVPGVRDAPDDLHRPAAQQPAGAQSGPRGPAGDHGGGAATGSKAAVPGKGSPT